MKKAYILKLDTRIIFLSSKLRACYDCLMYHLPEYERKKMIGYPQMSRIMKKYDHYQIETNISGTFHMFRYPLYTIFSAEMFKK